MAKAIDSINQFSDDQLQCRVLRHAWKHERTFLGTHSRTQVYEIRLKCDRCKTRRIDVVGKREGALVSRTYEYQEGYTTVKVSLWGGRRQFNTEARLEMASRLVKRR